MKFSAVLVVTLCCPLAVIVAGSNRREAETDSHLSRSKRAILPTKHMYGSTGSFKSPNYPSKYRTNQVQVYIIHLPRNDRNYTVTLDIKDMDIEYNRKCGWDYLAWSTNYKTRVCGKKKGSYKIKHVSGKTKIKFYSDYVAPRKGFFARYNVSKDPDACDDNPCNNKGKCTPGSAFSYSCKCLFGYFGDSCEFKDVCVLNNPCQNNGTCSLVNSSYTCTCPYGYSGVNCSVEDKCILTRPCQNNGTCINGTTNYQCMCNGPYIGRYCEVEDQCLKYSPCQNNATCSSENGTDYTCTCMMGYKGRNCEVRDMCMYPVCKNGWCRATRSILGYVCMCYEGYTGRNCEDAMTVCSNITCENGGSCVDRGQDNFYCLCQSGFSGKYCEMTAVPEDKTPTFNRDFVRKKLLLAKQKTAESKKDMQKAMSKLDEVHKRIHRH